VVVREPAEQGRMKLTKPGGLRSGQLIPRVRPTVKGEAADGGNQVLGHEMAHAAWTLGDAESIRLVVDVQRRSLELARRAQTEGVAGAGFPEAVQAGS